MAKPIDQFGGWLRFFQVISWLNFAGSVVFFLFSVASLAQVIDGGDMLIDSISALQFLIVGACTYIMATQLPVQSADTPKKVALASTVGLFGLIAADLVIAGIEAHRAGDGFFAHFHGAGALWLVVFQFYIERSKRVLSYYGENYSVFTPNNSLQARRP